MKKICSIIISLCLCITIFTGCDGSGTISNNNEKGNRTGKEIAELLLANERLNSSALSVENGVGGLKANASMGTQMSFLPIASFTGSDFEQECNMLDFFQSFMENIQTEANRVADAIDYMKETITFTDVWVPDSGIGEDGKMLLTVDANAETLFQYSKELLLVCRRYTDENANDVYEILRVELATGNKCYQKYSPNRWYEFSFRYNDVANSDMFLVMENTRGYWNMFTTYWIDDPTEVRTNMQNLISTGDATYVNYGRIYRSGYQFENYTGFTDAGQNSDLVSILENTVEINLAAFSGIAKVETDGDNFITSATTTSGITLTPDQTIGDGSITFRHGYGLVDRLTTGTMAFQMPEGMTPKAMVESLMAALKELGITCKYSMDTVLANANNAVQLGRDFASYYKWNGYFMNGLDNVEKAMEVDTKKHQDLLDAYETVKNNKQIEASEKGFQFSGFDFSKVTKVSSGTVTFSDGKVMVKNLSATITNLAVLDAQETYSIQLALAKLNDTAAQNNAKSTSLVSYKNITLLDLIPLGGSVDADYTNAIILSQTGGETATYESGETFSLSQTAEFTLPNVTEAGMYTVVAYVATEDGIRVSEMIPVPFTSEVTYSGSTEEGLLVDMYLNDYQEMIAKYHTGLLMITPDTQQESYTYAEVEALLTNAVMTYGYPIDGAMVELYDPQTDTGTPIDSTQTLQDCICRLRYVFKADDSEKYVYLLLGTAESINDGQIVASKV